MSGEYKVTYTHAHQITDRQIYAFDVEETEEGDSGSEESLIFVKQRSATGGKQNTFTCKKGLSKLKCLMLFLIVAAVITILGFIVLKIANYSFRNNVCDTNGCPCGCYCSGTRSLFRVSCDGNNPQTILQMAQQFSNNITDISLEENNLSSLDASVIKKMSNEKMRSLYLRGNKFKTLETKELDLLQQITSLKAIDLSENPWDCNCDSSTLELVKWLKVLEGPRSRSENIPWVALVNGYNTTCASPEKWKGKPLMQMSTLCTSQL